MFVGYAHPGGDSCLLIKQIPWRGSYGEDRKSGGFINDVGTGDRLAGQHLVMISPCPDYCGAGESYGRITSYNVCYTKLLRLLMVVLD